MPALLLVLALVVVVVLHKHGGARPIPMAAAAVAGFLLAALLGVHLDPGQGMDVVTHLVNLVGQLHG